MAPMKRPASAAAGAPPKKKQANGAGAKCKAVADALLGAGCFPESVLRMLAGSVALALGVPKEERHPMQEQLTTMVGEVLSGVEAAAKEAIVAAQGAVDEVALRKAGLVAAAEAAASELTAKAAANDGAKAATVEAGAALKAAKAAVATADAEQKKMAAELSAIMEKKVKLEGSLAGDFVPLKDGLKEEDKTKVIGRLCKDCKDLQFDPSLMASLPAALSKEPSLRGSFDSMVIAQVEAAMAAKLAELGQAVAAGDSTKAAAAEKAAAATAALTAASEVDTAAKAELETAKAGQKEAEAASKAALKAQKEIEPETVKATKAFESASAKLEAFKEGPLAAYVALLELSNALPPVEEEPAAPVDEAAVPVETTA